MSKPLEASSEEVFDRLLSRYTDLVDARHDIQRYGEPSRAYYTALDEARGQVIDTWHDAKKVWCPANMGYECPRSSKCPDNAALCWADLVNAARGGGRS